MSANPPNSVTPASGALVTVPRPAAGTVARTNGMGGQELAAMGETATAATAAMARAQVEARFLIARANPRSDLEVRSRLLRACERPRFAEVAIYRKPVSKGIEGPSIRLAEEVARCMGNIMTDVITTYEDHEKRILQVSATDLENNLTHPCTVVVTKTVERSKADKGQTVRRTRINSKGEPVYEVDATDDEILNKVNALVSKALRTVILRLVPGDILEDAIDAAYATRRKQTKDDPHGQLKRLCDAFEVQFRLPVGQLAIYLGHPVDASTVDEIEDLRTVYTTLKDGEATWAEVLAHKQAERMAAEAAAGAPADAGSDPITGAGPPADSGQGQPPGKPPSKPATLSDAAARSRAARGAPPPAQQPRKQVTVVGEDGNPIDTGANEKMPPPIDDTIVGAGGRVPGEEG